MKRILGLVLGAFLSLLANVASAQIYYLMPGDFYPASSSASINFLTVNSSFAGVTVNGRSRWPYVLSGPIANAYQSGNPYYDDSTNYGYGVMFAVHPEFVRSDDSTTFPEVAIEERSIFFSLTDNASTFTPQYVCFKFRYRWINDGSSINEANNFRPASGWANSGNCINVAGKYAREMLGLTVTSSTYVEDEATSSICYSAGTRCPRGMLVGHIYRIRANDICSGSGTPLACCTGNGTGNCCDGPSGSPTSCSPITESVRIWGIKLTVDANL
jgi:hypothetical protein